MPCSVVSKLAIEPVDNAWFFFGNGDPAVEGLAAGVGSYFTRLDAEGRIYRKSDTGDTDWVASSPTVDDLTVTGDLLTTNGIGADGGATITVVERGSGGIHQTVLTLTNTPLPIVSVTTGNGVGGVKLYDFPAGRLNILGTMAALTWEIAEAEQANFTDGTPEGQMGLGTVAPANADALGTDATDDDFATAADITGTDYAGAVNLVSEPSLQMDGTATAKDLILTGLIDAADIDDDATTEVLVSGTVVVTWVNLGDI